MWIVPQLRSYTSVNNETVTRRFRMFLLFHILVSSTSTGGGSGATFGAWHHLSCFISWYLLTSNSWVPSMQHATDNFLVILLRFCSRATAHSIPGSYFPVPTMIPPALSWVGLWADCPICCSLTPLHISLQFLSYNFSTLVSLIFQSFCCI